MCGRGCVFVCGRRHHPRVKGSQFLARLTDGLESSDSALDKISAPANRHRSTKNLSLYDPQAADREVIKVLLLEFLNDKIKTGHKYAQKLPGQHHVRLKNPSGLSS